MGPAKELFTGVHPISYLGEGESGGKAGGLEFVQDQILGTFREDVYENFTVSIPRMCVIRTKVFDEFMQMNGLYQIAFSDLPDKQKAIAFQKANLPFHILGSLRMLVNRIKRPLVVRSSSMLEDAIHEPFAGIYGTKMTPNNQPDEDTRFRKLDEAIKYVYASTFFRSARDYMKATSHSIEEEKMALIIQEVVGKKYDLLFYPEISGVAKSFNYYPAGNSKPSDGVVHLALGLGKQIVDGGTSWAFSPAAPSRAIPFKSMDDMLRNTQLKFWAVNLGRPPAYNPVQEAEFLQESRMGIAEKQGVLKHLVSTFDHQSLRMWDGLSGKGARVLNFAPILKHDTIPLNPLVKDLMAACESALGTSVEIEFAVSLAAQDDEKHHFAFLQLRPMVVSTEVVQITEKEFDHPDVLIRSNKVLGNGQIFDISDIIYIEPGSYDARESIRMAHELGLINEKLRNEKRKYLLIGYGRWGTTDPWAGIPVDWGQISGAGLIVEASQADNPPHPSQASHFFHNVSSFRVAYFSLDIHESNLINWAWIRSNTIIAQTESVTHIRTPQPLTIKVDGRTGRGVILK